MKPIFARLFVLTFMGIMTGISMNAIFLQEGRVVHFEDNQNVKKVIVNVETPRKKPTHYVSSVKTKETLNRKIEDVLAEFDQGTRNTQNDLSLIHQIQSLLHDKGYHPGAIDGIAGPTTRAAIMAFEYDRGLKKTGIANFETFELLKGQKTERTKNSLSKAEKKQSQELVAALQKALKELGYNIGTADGIFGPMTRKYIKAFENDNNLKVTGRISGRLVETINKLQGRPLVLAKLN